MSLGIIYYIVIFPHGVPSHFILLLVKGKTHVLAYMVVPENTNAHPLIGRYFTEVLNVYVILVLHTYRLLVRLIVCPFAHLYGNVTVPQLLYDLIAQASSPFPPEPYAGIKLFQIPIPGSFRQSGQEKLHETFPRIPFRQLDAFPSRRMGVPVNPGKVDPVHPANHPPPCIGVYDLVQGKAFYRLTDERACHPLPVKAHPRLIIQIVQMIVIPSELAVGNPHILCLPVIKRIEIVYPFINSGAPFIVIVPFLGVFVNRTPPVVTFLRPDTHQTAGFPRPLLAMQPTGKADLEIIVPHLPVIEREITHSQRVIRHLPHPHFLLRVIPWTPVVLVHGSASGYTERHTYMIHVNHIKVTVQRTFHIIHSHAVLYLIIHMEYTDAAFQSVLSDMVNTHVEQYAAVLSSRKRNIYVIELPEYDLQAFLRQVIHVFLIHFSQTF